MSVWRNAHRKNRWCYDFVLKGKRHQGVCIHPDTHIEATGKRQAEQIESLIRERAGKADATAPMPASAYPLAAACNAHLVAVKKHRSWDKISRQIATIIAHFGPLRPVAEIGKAEIVAFRNALSDAPMKIFVGGPGGDPDDPDNWKTSDRPRSDRTVNYCLSNLQAVLTRAHRTPAPDTRLPLLPIMPEFEFYTLPKRLPRPVPLAAVQSILDTAPEHLTHVTELIANFGFRQQEVLQLRIDQIDFENRGVRLDGRDVKGKRDEFVQGSPAGMALLARLVERARAAGQTRVILYRPKGQDRDGNPKPLRPIDSVKRAWKTASAKSGAPRRLHDLKSTYVTAIARSAPAATVQRLARHRSYSTTRGYLEVSDDQARRAVDSLSDIIPTKTPLPESLTNDNDPEGKGTKALK